MSNENRRPWYKDPRIIIPAVIGVVGIVVVIVVAIITWDRPQPDFRISVNPMHGTVQQGGVISTAITVKGEHEYKEPVSLSASGQPPGVVVTFVPPLGEPVPTFTSNVLITVGSDVSIGEHEITIKGMGADGKERTTEYTLTVTVKPGPVISKPPPTPTLEIKITSPKEGDEVPVSIIVRGTLSGELPEGEYMWVVINPHASPDLWWPQQGRVDPWRGQWDVPAWLGGGVEFDIAVILVNERDDQYYRDYLRIGQETGSYPGIPLAASADTFHRITVTRK